ncbi:MAG: terpene cyclase/mutase family protein [Lentisphaerae bacterium]|nr:terpene cyclase/mutase family protein [Lentisphaerota bacterium]
MRKSIVIAAVLCAFCLAGLFVYRSRPKVTAKPDDPVSTVSTLNNRNNATVLSANSRTSGSSTDNSRSMVSYTQPAGVLGESVAREVEAAIDRALDWLAATQRDDGSWSNNKFPALTALAMQSFIHSAHPERDHVIAKAVKFILSCRKDNGGIYVDVEGRKGGGLSNYNTAICMTALHETGDKSLTPVVLKAREFIAGSQLLGGDIYDGGFGYDRITKRPYTDGLNTFYAVQAMALTAGAEDSRPSGQQRVDIDWDRTLKFLASIQNDDKAGADSAGGFFYKPGESKAGAFTNDAGAVVFRSYGSMTYVGLLALVYADVPRNDGRVLSAFHWAAKHWTLEENPGMGQEGVYFFYNVLSKALDVYGQDLIPRQKNTFVDWHKELAQKLITLQKIDPTYGNGYWTNPSSRFWEGDPVLVTAYSIMALQKTL